MERILKLKLANIIFIFLMISGIKCESKNIEFEKSQPMSSGDPSYIDWGTLRLTKAANRKDASVSGTVYVLKNLAEPEITLAYSLYRKNPVTKQYPQTPVIHIMKPICEAVEKEDFIYPDLLTVSNLPAPGVCPFPKGNYTINNYIIPEDKYKNFVNGEYKFVGTLTKNKKLISGYEFYAILS